VNEFRIVADQHPEVNWDDWSAALAQFAAATGLTVSAYDAQGVRRLGPFVSARSARQLEAAGFWRDEGGGSRLEQELAVACIASGRRETESFHYEMGIQAVPMTLFGVPCGAIVYGWVFKTFATGLGCERIAAAVGIPASRLWAEARLEAPVSAQRMATYSALLGTMSDAITRQSESIASLHRLARMREVFLASVSHELRSPLSAIALRLELLLHAPPDDPQRLQATLLKMREHVELESRLIEDLIDAARTRTGELSVRRQPAVLADILRDAVGAVQPEADYKAVHLDTRALSLFPDLQVMADPHRLQQLFWNLLFNAVKFTPSGGTVRIAIHPGGRMHLVEIIDSGRGIEPELLPHIFDPFRKQDHNNAPGLGLGLFIAKHIATLHEGAIDVRSAGQGQGATFTFSLPAHP